MLLFPRVFRLTERMIGNKIISILRQEIFNLY